MLTGRWVSDGDRYLFGPDAAEWAGSALALADGRYGDLDFHRMPTFTIVTAGLMKLGLPVAVAMHLWNRVSFWILPVVVYALGARSGSRAAGFGAGLMLAVLPKLVETTRAAGVDPTILFLLPVMLLVASVTASRWWLAPVAGVVSALATVTHYTTLPYLVPAVLLTLFAGGRSWRRWLGAILHAGTAALVLRGIFRVFPFPDRHQLGQAIQEGVQRGTVTGPALSRWDVVTDKLQHDSGTALVDALGTVLPVIRVANVPLDLLSVLLVLGAVGLFLHRVPSDREAPSDASLGRRWFARLRYGQERAHGVVLLLCLAPLPVLATVDAPERYSYNFLPIVLLLVWRGIASLLGAVDALAGLRVPRWPAGATCVAVALVAAFFYQKERAYELQVRPPPGDAVSAAIIGDALAEMFSRGGGASVPLREASIAIDRAYCPHSDCPRNQTDAELRRCMLVLDVECGGEGDIPYAILHGPNPALSAPSRKWLDDFVKQNFELARRVDANPYTAEIYAIPRDRARALSEGFETPAPDQYSVPPPPQDPSGQPQRPPGPP